MPSIADISTNLNNFNKLLVMTSMNQQALYPVVKPEYLKEALRQDRTSFLILDCRNSVDYQTSHIRGSLNVALPSLMLRRLVTGKLNFSQVLRHLVPDAADTFEKLYTRLPIILYDYEHLSQDYSSMTLMTALCKILLQEGCSVHCLEDGFESFHHLYPEWCESTASNEPPIVGLKALRITNLEREKGDGPITACDSSIGRETPFDDLCFPVEILPQLFLGNAQNSGDREALNKHKIRYILNVTPNLPNVFESSSSYKYMQIPIADHWSQNLASFFPEAIQFIDEARENGVGVLVHCLAGISRSVTIMVAYLMFKKRLSLEDAYEYVRLKKTNIAPNFNFMGQLQDFQQQLNLAPKKCQCTNRKDCRCHLLHFTSPKSTKSKITSPDSGIDFDRYS